MPGKLCVQVVVFTKANLLPLCSFGFIYGCGHSKLLLGT